MAVYEGNHVVEHIVFLDLVARIDLLQLICLVP